MPYLVYYTQDYLWIIIILWLREFTIIPLGGTICLNLHNFFYLYLNNFLWLKHYFYWLVQNCSCFNVSFIYSLVYTSHLTLYNILRNAPASCCFFNIHRVNDTDVNKKLILSCSDVSCEELFFCHLLLDWLKIIWFV